MGDESGVTETTNKKDRIRELLRLLDQRSPLIRGQALLSLAQICKNEDWLINDIVSAAEDPINQIRSKALFGRRIADLAIACLLAMSTSQADRAALGVLAKWQSEDRDNILRWAHRPDLI